MFACKASDAQALVGLTHLKSLGYTTEVLAEGAYAPVGSIVFYTAREWRWTAKNIRVAAHRLYDTRPEWAITTPFVVEIKPNPKGNLASAFAELARIYTLWFNHQIGVQLPWETVAYHTSYQNDMENWLELVSDVIGDEALRSLIMEQVDREKIRGRGGDVIFNSLGGSGRIITKREDVASKVWRHNSIYRALTGFTQPVVSYGTSDAANLFELLQAIKLGQVLDLPVVFETYPTAHNWNYWVEGFLDPSLSILGTRGSASLLPVAGEAKYRDAVITASTIQSVFPEMGLGLVAEEIVKRVDGEIAIWKLYHEAMKLVTDHILSLLRLRQDYALTTFEEICKRTNVWKMTARELAVVMEIHAGHEVSVLNSPDGGKFSSRSNMLPRATIEELHESGWWLGGAPLYDTIFSLGNYGGVVVMVKDSTAGRVNMMSKFYLHDESQLYLAPVGLFRLTAEGQNEDWSIDPLVFMEVLLRWGPERARLELHKIFDAMEVPLQPNHIGRKTVATVTLQGVDIRIQDI